MAVPPGGPVAARETDAPTLMAAGLRGLCPRCGQPGVFAGAIRFAPRCPACGLDLAAFNVGDGPAAFLTLIIGTLITTLAIVVELTFAPPAWVHVVLWLPITILAVLGSLRLAKGMLLWAEYRNSAREGRIDPAPPAPRP